MLSLIRPSSSPCLHQQQLDSFASTTSPASSSHTTIASVLPAGPVPASPCSNTPTTPSNASSTASTTDPTAQSLQFSISTPLNSAGADYKDIVTQFTAKAPQPYGVIPRRKKRASNTTSIKRTSPSLPSPAETSRNAVELKSPSRDDAGSCVSSNSAGTRGNSVQTQIIQPLFHSLQSLLPESTSSSTRLGFWANLKTHYLAASITSISWSRSSSTSSSQRASTKTLAEGFSPPSALRLSNSTPVAAINAATQLSASLTPTDDLQSLPNVASPSVQIHHGSVNFPMSVAAMDKFIRSDTIPLKTFTYSETPVVECSQPLPCPPSPRLSPSPPDFSRLRASKAKGGSLSPSESKTDARSKDVPSLPALPRHLAARETRSNADYLRMMAAELTMIRSRKLVSPLKPRGFLPRRKDPFRRVKSSLCDCLELPKEEDDHPLNSVTVGSWSSVSSAASFHSTSSSEYQSANEVFC
ncbi:hypothetical protein BGZ65_001081 [Modicella reniformis]|uniref:Uncharacterized protein n=1 Tax=Modicella reniformis TaxID=1440133 RepID=A0A9P6IM37_9FUNG|nr:hypothetical protein BGZ65_001081 [Modicella reniformis]